MRWSSCVLCLVSSLAWAAPSGANDAATTLDLPHAVARGGERGPGVAVASAPRGSVLAAQDASHTFFTLPPRLSVQAGPRFYGAGAGIEVGATLMQDIPLRAIGTARSDVADALLSATDANVSKARLDAMLRAGLAWAAVRESVEILALRRAVHDDAVELLRVVRARGVAGTVTPADVASAEAEVSLAASASLDGEGALVEATAELRFTLAAVAGEELVAIGDLAVTDDTPSDEAHALGVALEHNPSVAAARFRALTYDRDATLAHALYAPTFSFGASIVREGNGENVVQGIVAFPFPFSRPGAFEGARARAQADAELETVELEKAQLTRDVTMALHERQHTREVRAVLQTALAPLREAERLARITLDAGTRDITALLLARARRIATEERWIHALADVHRADLRYGRAIGRIPWRQP
jgi:outer membrane protein TolC